MKIGPEGLMYAASGALARAHAGLVTAHGKRSDRC